MSTVTQRPRLLFFGSGGQTAGEAGVLQADLGETDGGDAFAAIAITNSISPAQPSQELLCFASYVTVTHLVASPVTLQLRLYCDDRTPLTSSFTVPVTTELTISRFEIGWAETVAGDGLRVTQAPRAHTIRAGLVIPPGGSQGVLDVDGIECEIEVRAESISPVNAT